MFRKYIIISLLSK